MGLLAENLFIFAANYLPRARRCDFWRWRLLRLAGVQAERSEIRGPVNFTQYGRLDQISIGQGTFVNTGLRIGVGAGATVAIGANCAIGPQVSLETRRHEMVWTPTDKWGGDDRSIVVGDRCWLMARVTVVGGVTIGEGAVVAAGAVVTKDVAPYTFVGGVPARVIRSIDRPDAAA